MTAAEASRTPSGKAVPVIDISPYFSGDIRQRKEVAALVNRACRTIGFLVITGHGVSDELIERTGELTRKFFDLPLSIKQKYKAAPRGYSAIGASALAYTSGDDDSAPDFREVFSVGRDKIDRDDPYFASPTGRQVFPDNVYPSEIPALRAALGEYFDAMSALAGAVMRLFALALELDEHWFDDKIDKHMSNLSLSNYPDQPEEPLPNQLRAGAHTDWGSLTILRTEDRPGALEVQTPEGAWESAPFVSGAFIVNIGDLMAQWTNDQWTSTMHRVANPPRDKAAGSRRQSLIFFHQPNNEALIECIPSCIGERASYAPITSGEYLRTKLAKSKVLHAIGEIDR
jgi:isopenicillin N synthase-like dioxygenase